MKAAVLYEARQPLQVVEIDYDPPKRGEVLVKMGAAGICASDHHVIHGTGSLMLPAALGHEGAGTIESLGDGVIGLKPGDRCILSFVSDCGYCKSCRDGFPISDGLEPKDPFGRWVANQSRMANTVD